MRQNINFFTHVPKNLTVRMPAQIILGIWMSLIFLLCLLSGYQFFQNRQETARLSQLTTQKQALQQQVVKLTQQYLNDPKTKVLGEKVDRLNQEVQIKSRIMEMLQNPASNGFSKYLEVLAQEVIPNIWLTHIQITRAGSTIILDGHAYSLEAINRFIGNLTKNPVLKNYNIKLSNVSRQPEVQTEKTPKTELLDFVINLEGTSP